MKTYKKEIAGKPKVELIHLSFDQATKPATAWAVKEGMRWPTIMKKDTDSKILITPYFPEGKMGIPSYILVDRSGKEVARGRAAALAKIREMD